MEVSALWWPNLQPMHVSAICWSNLQPMQVGPSSRLILNQCKWPCCVISPDPGHPILNGGGATSIGNGIFDNIQNKNRKSFILNLIDGIFTFLTIMSNDDIYATSTNADSIPTPNIVWRHKDGDLWCKLPLHFQSQMSPMGNASFGLLVCGAG